MSLHNHKKCCALSYPTTFSCMMLKLATLLIVLTVVSCQTPSTLKVAKDIEAFFKAMDKDVDGKASYPEFYNSIYAMDSDKNGKVILREYIAGTNPSPEIARAVFNYFDSDVDGHLDEDDIKVTFNQYDVNRDRGISLAEFSTSFECMLSVIRQNFVTSKPIG
ncbi:hypothetical protein LOTGIDRAFT_236430 [Lottia gigantea]|uniref:EF-hand domain-containing protein n=1 Tax=Lottia gigantea TaxID=225164 RepID=V3ZHS8_LOTGI|nr:hypothetical protein LOTGIDRAFT_236430 [Lottia gigantea]ESO83772.1 hypothetical protein LOTGIDRAFT_236430 [Lottia gigantea]